MAKILIVEDERDMAEGLKDNFEFDGHEVALAADGESGMEMALSPEFHLILLDVMLPKKSGLDICRDLRARGVKTPIIMLTARGQEIDKVLGLELGADDYITKPFSVRELLARVKAVLRRSPAGAVSATESVQIGCLEINFAHYTARDQQGEVEMTHKEFEIVKYLYEHAGQTISRDQLLEDVWGYDAAPTSRTIDNHILKLRKKIETDPDHPRHILTVHGIGYKYVI